MLYRYGHLMDQSVGDAGVELEAAVFGGDPASDLPAEGVRDVPSGESSQPREVVTTA